jgi:carbonic anhydrase/acetyltransferase-like protein (isoleucine patch superfamily)
MNPLFNPLFLDPPDLSPATFIAPDAQVIGAVHLEEGVSIWYCAVLRGDVERIVVGHSTNIQDGAVVHGDPGIPTILGNYVTVGHRAIIHSATVEDGAMIGMGAILLNGVTVGRGSIVGAGAVITKDVAPYTLVAGVPGKPMRVVAPEEAEGLIHHAQQYEELAKAYKNKGLSR